MPSLLHVQSQVESLLKKSLMEGTTTRQLMMKLETNCNICRKDLSLDSVVACAQ